MGKDKVKNSIANKAYHEANKQAIKERKAKWYKDNKTQTKATNKAWRKANRIHINEYQVKYQANKYKTDSSYKLKLRIRKAIKMSIQNKGYKKNGKTIDILGCSFQEFKIYLEKQFEVWMNWDNHGLYNGQFNYGWDIDHIEPLANASTLDDVIRLNHYTNLRPLCSKVNRFIKRDKFI